jgi:hypothetical protein
MAAHPSFVVETLAGEHDEVFGFPRTAQPASSRGYLFRAGAFGCSHFVSTICAAQAS